MIEVLPAIDLLGGRAVRLLQGRREDATVVGAPLALAEWFAAQGAKRLHVVDLDGAFEGRPRHLDLVRDLAQILPLQLGGGLRTPADIEAAFAAGADRVIVGTAAVEQPELLTQVPVERLVVGIDVKNGRVAVRGWDEVAAIGPRAFAERMAERGVKRVLCTAVHRDGTLEGPDLDVLREVSVPGVAVIASGGIGSLADIAAVRDLAGVEAVVIGKALYASAFTLPEALETACS